MKVGIDARLLGAAGIGRYLKNLIDSLQTLDKKNAYFIFLLKEDFHKLSLQKNFKKIEANFKWYTLTEQIKFPPLLDKYKLDLVHFPHFNIPILYGGKFVVTIHDLVHKSFNMRTTAHGKLGYKVKHLGYTYVFKSAVSRSEKIFTVSNFVKKELIKKWSIPKDKILVTYEAVDTQFQTIVKKTTEKKIKKVFEKYNITPPFILYVGSAHPHKNVERLIEAFKILRGDYQDLQLVLVGKKSFFWDRVNKNIPATTFLCSIDDQELVALYKGAQVYVQPSLEEGFGLPVLEAMSCGCSVVSSSAGSLPEVGGDGAVYFSPGNTSDMVDKIALVLNNQKLRNQLIGKGKIRYKQFSWERLAEQTLDSYKEAI